ncbi:hypothetical protein TNCV_4941061 [Trichonephila clavipes]|nr:hypothetical protein TNCV_4941061 [Trichonephila clavipes]
MPVEDISIPKIDHNGSIILRSGECASQVRCLTQASCSSNHDWISPAAWMGALSSCKIPSTVGNKVCIIAWTWSAKISLHFTPVILPFRVTIDPEEKSIS